MNPESSLQSFAEIAAGDRSEFRSVGVRRFMVVGKKAKDSSFDRCAMMGISTRRFYPSYNSGFPLQLRLIRPLADTRNDGRSELFESNQWVLISMNEGSNRVRQFSNPKLRRDVLHFRPGCLVDLYAFSYLSFLVSSPLFTRQKNFFESWSCFS